MRLGELDSYADCSGFVCSRFLKSLDGVDDLMDWCVKIYKLMHAGLLNGLLDYTALITSMSCPLAELNDLARLFRGIL